MLVFVCLLYLCVSSLLSPLSSLLSPLFMMTVTVTVTVATTVATTTAITMTSFTPCAERKVCPGKVQHLEGLR